MADGYVEPEDLSPAVDQRPKCWKCSRTLAEYVSRPWSIRCHRCKSQNRWGQPPTRKVNVVE